MRLTLGAFVDSIITTQSARVQAQAKAEADDADFNPENPEAGAPEAGTEEAS